VVIVRFLSSAEPLWEVIRRDAVDDRHVFERFSKLKSTTNITPASDRSSMRKVKTNHASASLNRIGIKKHSGSREITMVAKEVRIVREALVQQGEEMDQQSAR